MPTGHIFVQYYGHSLRGVNLTPLRSQEKISDTQERSSQQWYETTFFSSQSSPFQTLRRSNLIFLFSIRLQ